MLVVKSYSVAHCIRENTISQVPERRRPSFQTASPSSTGSRPLHAMKQKFKLTAGCPPISAWLFSVCWKGTKFSSDPPRLKTRSLRACAPCQQCRPCPLPVLPPDISSYTFLELQTKRSYPQEELLGCSSLGVSFPSSKRSVRRETYPILPSLLRWRTCWPSLWSRRRRLEKGVRGGRGRGWRAP